MWMHITVHAFFLKNIHIKCTNMNVLIAYHWKNVDTDRLGKPLQEGNWVGGYLPLLEVLPVTMPVIS